MCARAHRCICWLGVGDILILYLRFMNSCYNRGHEHGGDYGLSGEGCPVVVNGDSQVVKPYWCCEDSMRFMDCGSHMVGDPDRVWRCGGIGTGVGLCGGIDIVVGAWVLHLDRGYVSLGYICCGVGHQGRVDIHIWHGKGRAVKPNHLCGIVH